MPRNRSPVNLGLIFDWHAEQATQTVMHLDRPFDIEPDGGTVYDGARLASTVAAMAARLYAAGLRRDDRLVVVKDNHYDTVLVAAGAARIGALPVMIGAIGSIETVGTMIRRADPAVLVIGARFLDQAVRAGVDLTADDRRIVRIGTGETTPPAGVIPLDDLRDAPPVPPRARADDEPMIVTHSSGTTGVPKLVVHSAGTAIGAQARLESSRLPVVVSRRTDTVGSSISFAHFRVLSWTAGQLRLAPGKLLVIADHAPDQVARFLDRHRPTTLEACPNIFQRWEELADRKPELFAGVRLYISTFDAIHPRTVRTFLGTSRRRMPLWAHGWGQSETGPLCSTLFTRRSVRRRTKPLGVTNQVGWPLLCRVRVVDQGTGRGTGRRPGLLMAATTGRCLDYLGEEDRHRAKIDGRWWNTGDLGQRAGLFRYRLLDREVDMIPGASCIELESVLLDRLETATEVVILGVPGRLPVPVLAMRDNHLDPARWRAAVADLPPLSDPRVVPWEDMPRTATWKIRRLALREQVLGTNEAIGTGRWT
ncbi:class I adenylate-forming enzyme family protein [Jidongwangia harbinensis]|uniref:class I adenylate-forming enzyme family protein n=1 Tax=Jidongwangia harbinensis TaxID=2878561 RepID=UPI001CDA120E|nr:class I adenylate-forming enzyme family protein [Jidongwangia harbinensis]MCA2211625.1 acyl--CoA ligase [Jidongwangia harbinensis]